MIATFTGCSKTKDNNSTGDKEVSNESDVEQNVLQPTVDLGEEKNNNNDEDVIKGCYVEKEMLHPTMEPDERKINIALSDENQLEYYTVKKTEDLLNSTYNCYTLVDGSYQKESVEWANKAASEFSYDPVEYYRGQDGYGYILYTKPLTFTAEGELEYDKIEYGVIKEAEDSKGYIDVTPTHWKQGTFFQILQVTKDGMLSYLIYQDEKLEFYDPVKQEVINNFQSSLDYVIQGDMLYYIPIDAKEIQIVQLSDNKVERIELESNSISIDLEVSNEGDVILLDDQGIHQYKKDGTLWEKIVEGNQLNLSLPNLVLDFVLVPGIHDTYYVMNYVDKEDVLLEYQYNENKD